MHPINASKSLAHTPLNVKLQAKRLIPHKNRPFNARLTDHIPYPWDLFHMPIWESACRKCLEKPDPFKNVLEGYWINLLSYLKQTNPNPLLPVVPAGKSLRLPIGPKANTWRASPPLEIFNMNLQEFRTEIWAIQLPCEVTAHEPSTRPTPAAV